VQNHKRQQAKEPEHVKRLWRESNYRRTYGLSAEDRDTILADPCMICGGVATVIDHCHESGVVRGGLCNGCNSALGHMKDDPERMRAAAAYIEAFRDDSSTVCPGRHLYARLGQVRGSVAAAVGRAR
jgi:hypothetical protein